MLPKMLNEKKQTVAIIGSRGYSGLELARLLKRHPQAELVFHSATQEFALAHYLPEYANTSAPKFVATQNLDVLATNKVQTVFLATPAETSLELAPHLLKNGHHVIDLSGAFRLQSQDYDKWYGFAHTEPSLLQQATYGLMPWAKPATQKPALVANPGCYATSILMGLLPLLKKQILDVKTLVIDAKSGTSGAGRKAAENLLFTEVEGECLPYKVGKHQHLPEIKQWAEKLAGVDIDPMMSTHLLPVRRGIISAIYARVTKDTDEATITEAFSESYSHYPLVEFAPLKDGSPLLSLKRTVGSARTAITYRIDGDRLYMFSTIDNLIKGAAGQAIENFNSLNDLPVATGLTEVGGLL